MFFQSDTMPLSVREFSQIVNDFALSGTHGLQGLSFAPVIRIFNEYFTFLQYSGKPAPEHYVELLQNFNKLVALETNIQHDPQFLQKTATDITRDIGHLSDGQLLLLPGGWSTHLGGHALIYQFTRHGSGFYFSVINTGSGLQYHAKQSVREKELYHSVKLWGIPAITTEQQRMELSQFITRLLRVRFTRQDARHNRSWSAETLYEEILPSITYCGGVELDARQHTPGHARTAGQFGGSCSPSSVQEMFKINSVSLAEYQHFILPFKVYVTCEFANACLRNEHPLTEAIAEQIRLGIENNIRIATLPELFDQVETQALLEQLTALQSAMLAISPQAKHPFHNQPDTGINLGIQKNTLLTDSSSGIILQGGINNIVEAVSLQGGRNLLNNVRQSCEHIGRIASGHPACQYYLLEQLILALPIEDPDRAWSSPDGFYRELQSIESLTCFLDLLHTIQMQLGANKKSLLDEEQTPTLNVLVFSVLILQIEVHERLTRRKNLPSFSMFNYSMMNTLLGTQKRNPFFASNHPKIDSRLQYMMDKFSSIRLVSTSDYHEYYNAILKTQPELNNQLKEKYAVLYGQDVTRLHVKIRALGLQSLYLISLAVNQKLTLCGNICYLVDTIHAHLRYESSLRDAINPFFTQTLSSHLRLEYGFSNDNFYLFTPLYPTYIAHQTLQNLLPKSKYALIDGPIKLALERDTCNYGPVPMDAESIFPKSNRIQLLPADPKTKLQNVTQTDIVNRNYFHLRQKPEYQIPMTLDYFTLHVENLSDTSCQRYVEANLFQPQAIQSTLYSDYFLPQFDRFLANGFLYYNQNGQFTLNSLFFLRMAFLLDRYMLQSGLPEGAERLRARQKDIEKQLTQADDPRVIYVLQQYLFLNLAARLEKGDDLAPLLYKACSALVHINTHTNPQLLEDVSHRLDVERSRIVFLSIAAKAPESLHKEVATSLFYEYFPELGPNIVSTGVFPDYACRAHPDHRLNLIQGKFFVNRVAKSGVPLIIQNHSLIHHLGLQHITSCYSNKDESRLTLSENNSQTFLFYRNKQLTVQKDWRINGKNRRYELQALSPEHLAYKANITKPPVTRQLPAVLMDGSMDFWAQAGSKNRGILVQNNQARYYMKNELILLDEKGQITQSRLAPPTQWQQHLLHRFEHDTFMLHIESPDGSRVELPRYQLVFEQRIRHGETVLIHRDSGEQLVQAASPVHPLVAGIVLSKEGYSRYLVPVQRVYVSLQHLETCDVYPFVHDINNRIPQEVLDRDEKDSLNKAIWHYQNSEQYVSFQLENNEPVTDTVADALYLTYLYLASNQPGKAWSTLENCNTHLGGLTGDSKELLYLTWIVQDLPFILAQEDKRLEAVEHDDPHRCSLPYVATQLKAISLLCDYLNQGHRITLPEQKKQSATNNQRYAELQRRSLNQFMDKLPSTLYDLFTRMQALRRHARHTFTLSRQERQQVLRYYHERFPKNQAPLGALGCEWTQLSFEALLKEQSVLISRQRAGTELSVTDSNRLSLIQQRIDALQPVLAKSTLLEQVPIDLDLPKDQKINSARLTKLTQDAMETWLDNLPGKAGSELEMNQAVDRLDSEINDDDFILNFPLFFQLACHGNGDSSSSSSSSMSNLDIPASQLRDFCTKTLIANRHITVIKQHSNIPFLCNLLYRIMENTLQFREYTQSGSLKLGQLINKARILPVTAIRVYQAKDCYQDVLLNPDDLKDEIKHQESIILLLDPVPEIPVLQQTGINNHLALEHAELLTTLLDEFESIHLRTQEQLLTLGNDLDESLERMLLIEADAGKRLLALEKEKNALGLRLIQNPELVAAIRHAATQSAAPLDAQINQTWNDALALANQGPDDPKQARLWQAQQQAKARPVLIRQDLLSLYCHADGALSLEKTGLSLADASLLHNRTHQALVLGICKQIIDLVMNKLDSASPEALVQALDVLARTGIPGLDEPSMVLIQHEDNKILRRRQVSALSSLLKRDKGPRRFHETIEKIIMGGGKSKIVLPILAEKKAEGDNLVVIEVPPALLATNHIDMNRTTQRLFGKRAWRFEFNRSNECSPDKLEKLYHHFTDIMTRRDYLVSTVESIQSLELKYLELLLQEQDHDETWNQQIYWCDKINALFRHHADAIIDELHQGLSFKKKLNYTHGKLSPLNPAIIKAAALMFSYTDTDLIRSAPVFDEQHEWLPLRIDLATKLVNNPDSPIHAFVQATVLRYGAGIRHTLVAYLSEQSGTECEAVLLAPEGDKQVLGFLKGEINKQIPFTLVRQLRKQYGASQRANISAEAKTQAIPYLAANVANERNRVGIDLQAINYTCQMMLLEGVSQELFVERILEWKALAGQELFQTPGITDLNETPTARSVRLLLGDPDFRLSDIDVKNSRQIDELHTRYQFHQSLILDMLREVGLKQIKQDGAIIASDNFAHVDQFRSVQGVSGTPPMNPGINHIRFRYNPLGSLGTDDYLFELLLEKNTPVLSADYLHVHTYLAKLFTQSPSCERTRMIIDIKGTFTGVSNYQVAREIAAFITANPTRFSNPFKQVLYFNEEQMLCALDVNHPGRTILIGSSDHEVINRLLGSSPGERFTLYDQIHTSGTDILQDPQAHALVLVDAKLLSAEFLQGVSRPRGLAEEQTVELIVPSRLQGISLQNLREIYKANDIRNIRTETPNAIQSQIRNQIRNECLISIQKIPSKEAERKSILARKFYPVLVQEGSTDYFARYGGIKKRQATDLLLNQHRQKLEALRATCLSSAGITGSQDEIQGVTDSLLQVIRRGLPFCDPEYDIQDQTQSLEVEMQTEVHCEIELEIMTLNERYQASRLPACLSDPPTLSGHLFHGIYNNEQNYLVSLNGLCALSQTNTRWFSRQLLVTRNFKWTYQGQSDFLDAFGKPVFLIWYYLHNENLYATLLCTEEVANMENSGYFRRGSSWLSSTQDTLIRGTRPTGILENCEYQSLREQIRFFNGEMRSLLHQECPLHWLQDHLSDKLDFFENRLLAYRPGCAPEFRQLRAVLTMARSEGFAYVAKQCFNDCTRMNWLELFPETIPSRALEYTRFAEAFQYVNTHWLSGELLALETLQTQYNLPMASLSALDTHLKQLDLLSAIIRHLELPGESSPFLTRLSEKQSEMLESLLGLSSQSFARSGESATTSGFRVLAILSTHPVMYQTREIDDYFHLAASQFRSVETLQALLDNAKKTPDLIHALAQNPVLDNSLIERILDFEVEIDEATQGILIEKYQDQSRFSQFIARIPFSVASIDTLLQHPLLQEEHHAMLLDRCDKVDLMQAFISGIKLSHSTMSLLLNHAQVNEDHIGAIVERCQQHELLTSFISQAIVTHRVSTGLVEALIHHIESIQTGDSIKLELIATLALHPETSTQTLIEKTLASNLFNVSLAQDLYAAHQYNAQLFVPVILQACARYDETLDDNWARFLFNLPLDKKDLPNAAIDAMLQSKFGTNTDVLEKIALREPLSDNLAKAFVDLCHEQEKMDFLRTLILKPDANPALIKAYMQHEQFTPALATELLDAHPDNFILDELVIQQACLKYTQSDESKWLDLLATFPLGNRLITDRAIINILGTGCLEKPGILEKIIQRSPLSENLTRALALAFASTNALGRLQRSGEVSPEIFEDFIQRLVTSRLLSTQFILQLSLSPQLLTQRLKGQLITWIVDQVALRSQLWSSPFTGLYLSPGYRPLFSNAQINRTLPSLRPEQVLELLGIEQDQVINTLNLAPAIQQANAQQLARFINCPKPFSNETMASLCNTANTSELIHDLLGRGEMNANMASILFNKANYDFRIENWPWLNNDLRQTIITHSGSDDYDSIRTAMQSTNNLRNVFDSMTITQNTYQTIARHDTSRETKLTAALYKLRIKACQQARKAIRNERKYGDTARTAFELHSQIRQAIVTHANNPVRLLEACTQAIGQTREVLAQPQGGFKQALLDIVNALLIFTSPLRQGDWRLFKATTGRTRAANQLIAILQEENNPPINGMNLP